MLNSANVFIQYISHPVINKNFSHIQFLLQNLLINILFLISYVTVAGASPYSAGFPFNPAARIASTTKFFPSTTLPPNFSAILQLALFERKAFQTIHFIDSFSNISKNNISYFAYWYMLKNYKNQLLRK